MFLWSFRNIRNTDAPPGWMMGFSSEVNHTVISTILPFGLIAVLDVCTVSMPEYGHI